ncbi:restriction endonuclease [Dactylosporangium cerinum]
MGAARRETITGILHGDARTAWAYRQYIAQREPGVIGHDLGRKILAAVEPGDHVELFADAAVSKHDNLHHHHHAIQLTRTGTSEFIVVRTMRSLMLCDRKLGSVEVLTDCTVGGASAFTSRATAWPNVGWATYVETSDGRTIAFKIFLDKARGIEHEAIDKGVGRRIMRLPETPDVPPIPDLDSLPEATPADRTAFLPTDWRSTEDITRAHMRSLGFVDAELTGGSRDGGIDVVAQDGVAQVKMQALPIGAPPVQQLRGTRPHIRYHLFYSTSGYTAAALRAANEIGVILFKIERDGDVSAANNQAAALARDGVPAGEAQEAAMRTSSALQVVEEYAGGVRQRILDAVAATDLEKAGKRERYKGHHRRALRYLDQALTNLDSDQSFNSARSAAVFYRHTELLAHVWFQEMGVPYPGGAKDAAAATESLDSCYD